MLVLRISKFGGAHQCTHKSVDASHGRSKVSLVRFQLHSWHSLYEVSYLAHTAFFCFSNPQSFSHTATPLPNQNQSKIMKLSIIPLFIVCANGFGLTPFTRGLTTTAQSSPTSLYMSDADVEYEKAMEKLEAEAKKRLEEKMAELSGNVESVGKE